MTLEQIARDIREGAFPKKSASTLIEDLKKQVDTYGLALMFIREGVTNPSQVAKEALEKFGK
jgi:hypothetical protein